MDWIDPRYSLAIEEGKSKSQREKTLADSKGARSGKKAKPLASQVAAALAQPLDVWASALDHALSRLKWPAGCTAEGSFLFSTVAEEQADVLARAGVSVQKLAKLVATDISELFSERAACDAPRAPLDDLGGMLDTTLDRLAFDWLDTADAYASSALAVAALAWNIPEHATRAGNDWLSQWLQSVVDRTTHYTADLEEAVLCHLVLQCELPLLIGVGTATSKKVALSEASLAMDALAEYLERSQDNTAPWLVHGASYLRASLASVLRSRVLADALGMRKWYPPQQKALAELLKHAARWTRSDGTQKLEEAHKPASAKAIWHALAAQTRTPKPLTAAMNLVGIGTEKREAMVESVKPRKLPPLTHYCENAACVAMLSDWRHKGGQVSLDFSETEIQLEALGPKGAAVLQGPWTATVELDGQSQLQLDEWAEVCWFSDEDVDYLELEAKFGKHARVQRQAVLFREQRLLLLADALLCEQPGNWSLRSELNLPRGAEFTPDAKATEGLIRPAKGPGCLVLPLFLPEWRRQIFSGGLQAEHECMVVHQSTNGTSRVYMPVMVSLCGSHAKQPFTWRRLTVGEDLRLVSPEEAVAYRVQYAEEQLLIYRTLDRPMRRTALGMHTGADFFVGRFDADEGDTDTLVEVDASE